MEAIDLSGCGYSSFFCNNQLLKYNWAEEYKVENFKNNNEQTIFSVRVYIISVSVHIYVSE